jgi:hypothetical protein
MGQNAPSGSVAGLHGRPAPGLPARPRSAGWPDGSPATIGRKKIMPRWEWSGNLLQVRWFAFVGGVGFGERK